MTTTVPYNAGLDWGTVPDAASLPNVSGSPIQSPDVRVGARAYVPGTGAYVCDDPTEGAATWTMFADSGLQPPVVPVWVEDDFPAASGGVITCETATVYQINASVTLTTGNRIVLPAGSSFIGTTAAASKVIGDYDGALVTIGGGSGTGRLDSVTIQNNSTGSSAEGILHSESSSTLIAPYLVATAKNAAYRVPSGTTGVSLSSDLASFTSTAADAIDIEGGGSFGLNRCATVAVAASARHIRLRSTATIGALTMNNHGFIAYGANQIGILDDGATISNRMILTSLIPQGPSIGTFTPNSGWTQGTARWHVINVTGLPDSSAIGQAQLTTPTTVPVAMAATYYDITPSPAASVWSLDSDSERFDLVATTGVQNGELYYTSQAQRRGLIVGSVSVRRASGSPATGCRLACYVDGVLHTSSVASVDVTNRLTQLSLAQSIHLFQNTPTKVKLVIMSEDAALDLYVERASLAIICAVIS